MKYSIMIEATMVKSIEVEADSLHEAYEAADLLILDQENPDDWEIFHVDQVSN